MQISVLVGDWMGGWLRIQFEVGPLHDPFEFPIFVTKTPCKAFGPKLRGGVPVDLLASPEWPAVRDRFDLSDPNELPEGNWPETVASDSQEQSTWWSEKGATIHMAWTADSWRVVRMDPNAATNDVATNGTEGARYRNTAAGRGYGTNDDLCCQALQCYICADCCCDCI